MLGMEYPNELRDDVWLQVTGLWISCDRSNNTARYEKFKQCADVDKGLESRSKHDRRESSCRVFVENMKSFIFLKSILQRPKQSKLWVIYLKTWKALFLNLIIFFAENIRKSDHLTRNWHNKGTESGKWSVWGNVKTLHRIIPRSTI